MYKSILEKKWVIINNKKENDFMMRILAYKHTGLRANNKS